MKTDTDLTTAIESAIGPLDKWAHQCHAASLALVRSGVLQDHIGGTWRVARGVCKGVGGQHSWTVQGDVYDRTALIVDITLWSYDAEQDRVWVGTMGEDKLHRPFGDNDIWAAGCPLPGDGPDMPLDLPPGHRGSPFYNMLRDHVAYTDRAFWMRLWSSNCMLGWPAAELLETFLDTYPDCAGLVPVDIIGMLTDRNPDGLYW
jgi:hypothetical protein